MMNASNLIKAAKKAFGNIKTIFRFPYIYIICISGDFAGLDDNERESQFSVSIQISVSDLRRVLQNSLMSLHLLTQDEFLNEYPDINSMGRGHHWLSALINQGEINSKSMQQSLSSIKVIHFYGYKGGQARSTLLGMVSTFLAEDGWKVLVVDSDIEAPSLDTLYARTCRSLSGTLLGVVQSSDLEITPERVKTAKESGGYVDLIACRPRSSDFDIDAAAFALRCALEPMIIEKAAQRIAEFGDSQQYDVLLIDHRSGLSPVALPWMTTLPGSTVICVRLDEQWIPAKQFIKSILYTNLSNPGVFISWKPDDESYESYRKRNNTQIDSLLDILAEATSEAGENTNEFIEEAEISALELQDHWIVWPYDNAFRQSRLPERKQLSSPSIESLNELRSILNIGYPKEQEKTNELNPSGAADEGDLIQTEAIQELKVLNNSISYILGRKGTGKTRLLRELTRYGIGEPLIVDSNSKENKGLKSPSPELTRASELYKDFPEQLWWHLLCAAIDTATTNTDILADQFNIEMEQYHQNDPIQRILNNLDGKPKRIFLIDGLETAFNAGLIFTYVDSLFRFIQTIESDSRLSKYVHIKLFLRSDLAARGYQNIEQQLYGKSLYLSWDTQKIFNFILSRITQISWYKEHFLETVQSIEEQRSEILKGNLSTEECEVLLMQIFPEKIRRNNLATKTFLKTYFADSASDRPEISASDKLRYYPRVFDRFLEVIANPRSNQFSFTESSVVEGKINHKLIFVAHEAAANEYLEQLKSELNYLINLSNDITENGEKIKSLLDAFEGLRTPFKLDNCMAAISDKTNISEQEIRTAIERMKSLGMFEDRPDYPGELRVGRLFKSSLKMRYGRKEEKTN